MIKHLYIKNFVLIDELSLDFTNGFSAFTGETGAGKSILIDAINMLCADRASVSFIQTGKEKAIIEGTFTLDEGSYAYNVLLDAGFECDEDTTFTREINLSGKSTVRINHRIATLSLLRECLKYEIDIHGQRDNAYLLNTSNHLHLLDRYLKNEKEVSQCAQLYNTYHALTIEKEKALQDTYNENDLEYFRYQINEIEEAELKEGEEEELQKKEKEYRTFKNSLEKFSNILSLYDESLSEGFYDLNKMVQNLDDSEQIEKIQNTVNDSYYNLTDAMDQIRDIFEGFEMSEEDINAVEERLYLIQKLKRKYGHTISDILEEHDSLVQRVEAMTHKQEYLEKIDKKIQKAFDAYQKQASILSEIRKKGALKLDLEIESHLKGLMLENARFKTEIKESSPSSTGSDKIEFLVSMNKGESLKPLTKTASGGEISRLMLGLKVIFTNLQGIGTVIFDEIDTGVSGPVATAIGKKMQELSGSCQVFSVTHLSQVAACADQQYLVAKSVDGERTHTSVKKLNKTERIEQLALIASGEITAASKKAAGELLERNRK